MKKNLYALTVLGRDRVGIISAVTGRLAKLGINIEDSSMARLKNEFAMILLIGSARALLLADLSESLKKILPDIEFSLRILKPGETRKVPPPSRMFSIKIYGADRVGIVAEVTNILASLGVNIVDMRTRLIENPADSREKKIGRPASRSKPVYILLMDAIPPASLKTSALVNILKNAARKMGVSAELSEYEPSEL